MHHQALCIPLVVAVQIAAVRGDKPHLRHRIICAERLGHHSGRGQVGIPATSSGGEVEPSTPLEYELRVIEEARDSTVDRWRDMYNQQAKDAMALGLPKSAVPELPQCPTHQDVVEAAETLRRIMQSFESAAL